jgi:hypothetical protein
MHHSLLENTWAKHERAKLHHKEIHDLIDSYSLAQRKCVGIHLQQGTGDLVYRLDRPLGAPPTQLRTIIGDVLFNYRSTLEYLMGELWKLSSSEPNKGTQFPIFDDAGSFNDKRRGRRMHEGVTSLIRAIIEVSQPYSNVYPGANEDLRTLNELHAIDKHHHLLDGMAGFYDGTYSVRRGRDILAWREIADKLCMNRGTKEVGSTLAIVPSKFSLLELAPSFEIEFGDSMPIVAGQPVRGTIDCIGTTVEDIVDQFERLFFFNDPSTLGRLYHGFKDYFPEEPRE